MRLRRVRLLSENTDENPKVFDTPKANTVSGMGFSAGCVRNPTKSHTHPRLPRGNAEGLGRQNRSQPSCRYDLPAIKALGAKLMIPRRYGRAKSKSHVKRRFSASPATV